MLDIRIPLKIKVLEMEYVIIALKIIVAVSLLNVWLVQRNKKTKWRGGDADTLVEEFKVYGLPVQVCYIVGILKVSLSLLLIASIWVSGIESYAALGLAALLTGSVVMHLKIGDPLYKSFPAALFLTLCLFIYLY